MSFKLKPALKFPRCLVCDRVLFLRTISGRKKKNITCPKCGLGYTRAAIKDADPERWERIRTRSLYEIKVDSRGRKVLYHGGLGSRRVAS